MTQHHHGISCCREKIIALFDDLAVLAAIQPEFLEPIIEVSESRNADTRFSM
jgi:hypothetical protein